MGDRIVPPMTRRWYELLPPPYQTEKPVVAFLVPMDWEMKEAGTKKGDHSVMVACSPKEEKVLALQIFDARLKKYEEQREMLDRCGVKYPEPAYVGPISQLPQRLLLDESMTVLLFCRNEFWKRPVDLKRIWKPKPVEMKC